MTRPMSSRNSYIAFYLDNTDIAPGTALTDRLERGN